MNARVLNGVFTLVLATLLTACGGSPAPDSPPAEATTPAPAADPLTLVVAIDTSSSQALGPLNAIREGLLQFMDAQLPSDVPFGLVTFDDSVQDTGEVSTAREATRTKLATLSAAGRKTLLFAGLDRGLDRLRQVSGNPTNRKLVVISDGADELSTVNGTDAVIQKAKELRITIDTVWVGQPAAATRDVLRRLSELTGGVHTDLTNPETMAATLTAAMLKAVTPRTSP